MSYINANRFIIIQEADRDANTSFRQHRARRSLGGVDCVAPVGTPILAPADCTITNHADNGSGGHTIRITYKNAAYGVDEMMHLSKFVSAGSYRQFDIIGYSGDSAAPGQPHVHWHKLGAWYDDAWGSTNRYNPFNYFTANVAALEEKKIEEMAGYSFVKDAKSDTIFAVSLDTGKRVGVQSPYHLGLLKRARVNDANDPMLAVELDIVRSYLRVISGEGSVDNGAVISAIERIAITPEAIKDVVKAAIAEGIVGGANATDAQLDAAADRFAKLLGIRIAGGTLATV